VWTLLRTPAADISVVYNSFARVWSFFVHVPVSARRILWRGRPRYAAPGSQSTALLPIRCRACRGVRAGAVFSRWSGEALTARTQWPVALI
jgi:anti-sigma factor RsiW